MTRLFSACPQLRTQIQRLDREHGHLVLPGQQLDRLSTFEQAGKAHRQGTQSVLLCLRWFEDACHLVMLVIQCMSSKRDPPGPRRTCHRSSAPTTALCGCAVMPPSRTSHRLFSQAFTSPPPPLPAQETAHTRLLDSPRPSTPCTGDVSATIVSEAVDGDGVHPSWVGQGHTGFTGSTACGSSVSQR